MCCRIPKESNRRSKWIKVIKKYQIFDDTDVNTFKVCHRHFSSNDIIVQKKTRLLKLDAVPSIFADVEDACSNDDNNSDELKKNAPCESCEILQFEKTNLSKKIASMAIKHDIMIQKMKREIISLENRNKEMIDRFNASQKLLSKEKLQNLRLHNTVADLKKERYISPDDTKFMKNVILITYDCIQ